MKKNYDPVSHSLTVDYLGTSVIGIKYDKGIIIAADTRLNRGGSYLVMNNNEDRLQQLTNRTIIGYSGEFSDLQETTRILKELILQDELDSNNNGFLGPNELSNYLSSIHYNQRNKMDPYLNSAISGGIDFNGDIVLTNIDSFGTFLTGDYFCTSMGSYFCYAILRKMYPDDPKKINREQAIEILKKCFEVLFYRDLSAGDVIKFIALEKQDAQGTQLVYFDSKFKIEGEWDYAVFNKCNEDYYV